MSQKPYLVASNSGHGPQRGHASSHLRLVPDTGGAVPVGRPVHCLDCDACSGVCAAYLEATSIPDTILGRRQRRT